MNKTKIIGISGASGSGKSTLAAALCESLNEAGQTTLYLPADRYFKKDLPKMISPLDGQEYPDWNHPTSIDSDRMVKDLDATAQSGEYRYIVAEGAFIYCIEPLRVRMAYKIWVDASIEMRIFRRISRNVVTKGQTVEFIGGYYLSCARYREREFSLPSAVYADFRIQNEKKDEYRDAIPTILSAIIES